MSFWDWFLGKLLGTRGTPRRDSAAPRASSSVLVLETGEDRPGGGESKKDGHDDDAPWWCPDGADWTTPRDPMPPRLDDQAMGLERILSSQLAEEDITLPPLPVGVERVLSAIESPKSNATKVADLVAEDPVRTAAVLRTANSAMYVGVERVTRLPAAISRIGMSTLRMVMMRESLHAATIARKGVNPQFARRIWERSLASMTVMRELANFTNVNQEEAAVTGLLCDIGSVAILREAAEQADILRRNISLAAFDYLCHKHHEQFGRHIAAGWRMPPKLQSLVADHHRVPADDEPLRVERHMLQFTDMVLGMLGYAGEANYRLLETTTAAALGLSERSDVIEFLKALPEQIESVVSEEQ